MFRETYTANQRALIQRYIDTGERPFSPGCMWCDEGFTRIVTGNMDIFLISVSSGLVEWPWPVEEDREVGELADDETEETEAEAEAEEKV